MKSGLHSEAEIAWLPAKSAELAAAGARATGSTFTGADLCPCKVGQAALLPFALHQNMFKVAHP